MLLNCGAFGVTGKVWCSELIMQTVIPLVEAHAINTYAYCPRRCYYEYVERVFYHNFYTVHGKFLHEYVDRYGQEHCGERMVIRSLFFKSEALGLVAKCDIVEEENGEIYPVEYKRGKIADWENNHLQLCSQALLLKESLGNRISTGYLFFYRSSRRQKMEFNSNLRQKTLKVVESIQDLYQQSTPPDGIDEWSRCKHCSMVDDCLPHDRKK